MRERQCLLRIDAAGLMLGQLAAHEEAIRSGDVRQSLEWFEAAPSSFPSNPTTRYPNQASGVVLGEPVR